MATAISYRELGGPEVLTLTEIVCDDGKNQNIHA